MRIFLIALLISMFVGCNTTSTTPPSPNPPPVSPPAPAPPAPPSPPTPPSPPSPPAPPTVGQLQITVSGLPSGVPAKIFVNGPSLNNKTVEASTTLTELLPGEYTINTKGVEALYLFDTDPITQTVKVVAGQTAQASVVYKAITGLLKYTYEGMLLGQKPVVSLSGPTIGLEFIAEESPTARNLEPGQYRIEEINPSIDPNQVDSQPGFRYLESGSGDFILKAGESTPVHSKFRAITGSLDLRIEGLPAGTPAKVVIGLGKGGVNISTSKSSFINYLTNASEEIIASDVMSSDIHYKPLPALAQVSIVVGQVVSHRIVYTPIDSKLQVNVSGVPNPNTNKPLRVTGPGFNSGEFGSSKTFTQLAPGSYTVKASSFIIGQAGKPGCTSYTPDQASQTQTLVAGQSSTLSVAYTSEPCE